MRLERLVTTSHLLKSPRKSTQRSHRGSIAMTRTLSRHLGDEVTYSTPREKTRSTRPSEMGGMPGASVAVVPEEGQALHEEGSDDKEGSSWVGILWFFSGPLLGAICGAVSYTVFDFGNPLDPKNWWVCAVPCSTTWTALQVIIYLNTNDTHNLLTHIHPHNHRRSSTRSTSITSS